ncbi:Demethylrebeccamycin-D-glucose O-methyltransferase [Actinomadura rubteroloni]|uniref:Demethylrebeccamycin-D-glucose O-methyltransferase n=1 Tax=Actinomadura rubteroloni TaxID=1926885 RepID=A0A2P4UQM4_9ACTN|nr:methyltransferase domain-containing protein [Actinomadura rubteroloni]POM27343.1 Demethylrebeccamycin-D-glucose O-methyltransferase [Actinomadura rubteroloni]
MTETQLPTPSMVGSMYDRFNDLFTQHLGDNLHLGYWDDDTDDTPISKATDRITDMVAARLSPRPGAEILDVGCGNGRPSVRIATEYSVHVTGITVSPHQLRVAHARPEAGPGLGHAAFQLADAMSLPFPDARFDGAYAIESLLHMSDRARAISEIARTLRPGAPLVALDFYQDGDLPAEDADIMDRLHQAFQLPPLARVGEYETSMAEARLDVVDFEDITGHVRRSHRLLADAMRRIATDADFDTETRDRIVAYAELNENIGIHPQVHYTLITARRR